MGSELAGSEKILGHALRNLLDKINRISEFYYNKMLPADSKKQPYTFYRLPYT